MLIKLLKLWEHPQVQEIVGVLFLILAIHDTVQARYWNVALDIVMIFCAIQLIRRGNNVK